MSLYRVTPDKLEPVPRTTFSGEGLLERKDLQRLLRRDISPLGEDLLVVAEEFGEWEDSNRRIDLLCLDRRGNLVVVELKREDSGHMELQALRYAAMVAGLTLEQVTAVHARSRQVDPDQARDEVRSFLRLEEEDARLTGEVRILLVAAEFSTELTTCVLWLNQRGLDITCIRLRPYKGNGELLVDATQIIPLPEAADYAVRLRAQEQARRRELGEREQMHRHFWAQLVERSRTRTALLAGRSTSADPWLSTGIGRAGFALNLVQGRESARVECYISSPGNGARNQAAFQGLLARRMEIEETFGGPLDWQDLPGRIACRICCELPGGWQVEEDHWPPIQDGMIDALIRLDAALRQPIQELRITP